MFSQGTTNLLFDEMPVEDVIWDGDDMLDEMPKSMICNEELLYGLNSHGSLLRQIAEG